MESLAFHLFVVGTVIFALMTVVVYSFVTDSSLLDCSDLVGFFVCLFLVFFPPSLCLQVGNRLGF